MRGLKLLNEGDPYAIGGEEDPYAIGGGEEDPYAIGGEEKVGCIRPPI